MTTAVSSQACGLSHEKASAAAMARRGEMWGGIALAGSVPRFAPAAVLTTGHKKRRMACVPYSISTSAPAPVMAPSNLSGSPPSCARPATPRAMNTTSLTAQTATVSHKCWRMMPLRITCAFCGPMAMMSDRLSTRPAKKAGAVNGFMSRGQAVGVCWATAGWCRLQASVAKLLI